MLGSHKWAKYIKAQSSLHYVAMTCGVVKYKLIVYVVGVVCVYETGNIYHAGIHGCLK